MKYAADNKALLRRMFGASSNNDDEKKKDEVKKTTLRIVRTFRDDRVPRSRQFSGFHRYKRGVFEGTFDEMFEHLNNTTINKRQAEDDNDEPSK